MRQPWRLSRRALMRVRLDRMRALCLTAPRQAEVREVPRPEPADAEVVVRVLGCGVCGSDLNAWRGVPGIDYPLPAGAPGHEVFGEADGRLVTGLMWSGFAEYTLARTEHLLAIETPLLGEPLACAMNVVRRAAIAPGDNVAVVGFGYLAALIVQLLPEHVGGWVAVSRREDSRRLARSLGADAALDFAEVAVPLWDSFPVVLETAGVQQTLDFATWLVGDSGRLVIAGYHADGPRSVNLQTWNWKGIDVINAHEREPSAYMRGLREGLEVMRQRKHDLDTLITRRFTLDEVGDAFTAAETRPPGFVKGLITL
jgi:NADPH2:quinone reductase